MTTRHTIALLTLLFGACSDAEPSDPITADPPAPIELPEGLYVEPSEDASLAVWNNTGTTEGAIALSQSRGFTLEFAETVTLAPVSGACDGCADATWLVDVTSQAGVVSVSVIDSGTQGPGFTDLRFVPHDGFKPEFSPGPGVDVWVGRIVAISPQNDPPILDRDCEISVVDDAIQSFDCIGIDTDSEWTEETTDSWSDDGTTIAFVSTGAGFVGEVVDGRLTGRVLVGDVFVGVFDFELLTP